jgi:hypothetical protein
MLLQHSTNCNVGGGIPHDRAMEAAAARTEHQKILERDIHPQ